MKGIDRVSRDIWFSVTGPDNVRLTRHTAYHENLTLNRARTDVRANFSSNRIVRSWNSLPTEVKESTSVRTFTKSLEELGF